MINYFEFLTSIYKVTKFFFNRPLLRRAWMHSIAKKKNYAEEEEEEEEEE